LVFNGVIFLFLVVRGKTEGAPGATGCAWHGRMIGGESPLWDLLEVTMSRRQLHEEQTDHEVVNFFAARTCGMEAEGKPQHRTRVNPRKAGLTWVSVPGTATPNIQSRQDGIEGGGGGTSFVLTQGDLRRSDSGRTGEGNDDRPMPVEKSDLLIVARKPAKVGGAKGEME
jgi:hypothetical protein